jgi:single-strand DNA-binding protein
MNQLTTLVRIGKDSEVKVFDNGNAVLNFSAVHSEKYLDKDGQKKERSTWYEVAKWGKPETLNKLTPWYKKGAVILITGTVSARGYLDKVSNEVKASLMITARAIDIAKFADREGSEQPSQESTPVWKGEAGSPSVGSNFQQAEPPADLFTSGDTDDLPF